MAPAPRPTQQAGPSSLQPPPTGAPNAGGQFTPSECVYVPPVRPVLPSRSRTIDPGNDCLPCLSSRISSDGGKTPDSVTVCSSSARSRLEEKNANAELSATGMRSADSEKRDCNNGAVRNAGKGRYREGENRGPLTWTNFPEGKNALRAATEIFTEGCSPCRASARKTSLW